MSKRPPASCDPSARPLSMAAIGQRVKVHLNLHNGCYVVSIRGKVQGYAHGLVLGGVVSNVSQAGYRRCREEGVRNVHAWLEGTLLDTVAGRAPAGARRVSYNCLTKPPCFFYTDDGSCLVQADRVYCFPGAKVLAAEGDVRRNAGGGDEEVRRLEREWRASNDSTTAAALLAALERAGAPEPLYTQAWNGAGGPGRDPRRDPVAGDVVEAFTATRWGGMGGGQVRRYEVIGVELEHVTRGRRIVHRRLLGNVDRSGGLHQLRDTTTQALPEDDVLLTSWRVWASGGHVFRRVPGADPRGCACGSSAWKGLFCKLCKRRACSTCTEATARKYRMCQRCYRPGGRLLTNPPRGDDHLRDLERRARHDPAAAAQLQHERERRGGVRDRGLMLTHDDPRVRRIVEEYLGNVLDNWHDQPEYNDVWALGDQGALALAAHDTMLNWSASPDALFVDEFMVDGEDADVMEGRTLGSLLPVLEHVVPRSFREQHLEASRWQSPHRPNPPRRSSGEPRWHFSSTPGLLARLEVAAPNDRNLDLMWEGDPRLEEFRTLRGRRVTWAAYSDHVVWVPVEHVLFMEGNLWNFGHAAAILDAFRSGGVVPRVPAARLYRIDKKLAESTQRLRQAGELEYQRGMAKPWGPRDVGTYWVQLLDGNHRALAAIAAGEEKIPVTVSENYRADVLPGEWA